jgi:hypothetical protein
MTNINWVKEYLASDRKDKPLVFSLAAGAVLLLIIGLIGLKNHSMLSMLILAADLSFFNKIYRIATKKI